MKNLRSDTNRVCMVIQWGYFRATGRFFMINDFRESDVRYISGMLDIKHPNVDLPSYRDKRKICRNHQCMILKSMNFQAMDDDTKIWLHVQLENLISKQMQPREIIFHLSALCHQKQIEIPSYHYFTDHISKLYNKAEDDLLTLIEKNITEKQIKLLSKKLG